MPRKAATQTGVEVLGSKTTTKWINLQKIKAKPKVVKTQDYKPFHKMDMSTHTRIVPNAQNMINQLDKAGGGFYVELVPSDSGWGEWMELQKLGAELVDLRCATCGKRLPLNPNLIAPHFKIHRSSNGRNVKGGGFYLTLSLNSSPLPEEDDVDSDVEVG